MNSSLPRTSVLGYCLPPLRGWLIFARVTHSLRCGLHSLAASRLDFSGLLPFGATGTSVRSNQVRRIKQISDFQDARHQQTGNLLPVTEGLRIRSCHRESSTKRLLLN